MESFHFFPACKTYTQNTKYVTIHHTGAGQTQLKAALRMLRWKYAALMQHRHMQ
jgi:hypothetical protein